jgi:hypothetical protein
MKLSVKNIRESETKTMGTDVLDELQLDKLNVKEADMHFTNVRSPRIDALL